ncbi:MAG TPA: hypothetical protein VD772_10610, partial [Anseongella sp.]|nr:hypothetical protein [Anseongella sp.]
MKDNHIFVKKGSRFMIPVDEAFERVLSARIDFGSETLPLEKSCGKILRQQVHAGRDFPPFDRVCMDG